MDGSQGRTRATVAAVAVLVVAIGVVIVLLVSHEGNDSTVAGTKLTSAQRHGGEIFANTCSSCHTLKASKTTGKVGPNLDYVQPTIGQILSVIATGSRAATAVMPAGLLTGQDAADVADYVAKVADRRNID
jgi:mono/diheme cytochrome c family protein